MSFNNNQYIYKQRQKWFSFSYVVAVIECWKTLRGNYRRSLKKLKDWTSCRSGSGQQKTKKPRQYKFAVEMSFLRDVFELEDTEDSMTATVHATGDDDDNILVCCYCHASTFCFYFCLCVCQSICLCTVFLWSTLNSLSLCVSVHLSVHSLFVVNTQQSISLSYLRISMKLSGTITHEPKTNCFASVKNRVIITDPGTIFRTDR